MMKQFVFAPILVALLSVVTASAFAAGEGTAVGVNPDAAARLGSTDRVLQVGADVSVGELIVTGTQGQVQIVFDDDTRLVVGPRSSLKIETYLLASHNTAKKLAINALGGSFRFITGNSPKPAYTIKTPTASIAVRGTEFDLIVERSATKVMLYEGAVRICNNQNDCEDLSDKCGVGTTGRDTTRIYLRNDALRDPISAEFRYARFQNSLLPPFRVTGAGRCIENNAQANPGSSGSTPQTPTTQTQTNTSTNTSTFPRN